MPTPKFKVHLNVAFIETACARKGWTATDLCKECVLDTKTLLPGLDKESPKPVTMRTLKRLHKKLGGDIAQLSADPLPFDLFKTGAAPRLNDEREVPFALVAKIDEALASLQLAHAILAAIQRDLGPLTPPLQLKRIKNGSLIIYATISGYLVFDLLDLLARGKLHNLRIDGNHTVMVKSLVFPPRSLRLRAEISTMSLSQAIVQLARTHHNPLRLDLLPSGALRVRALEHTQSQVGHSE
jgi:hypothetical protein